MAVARWLFLISVAVGSGMSVRTSAGVERWPLSGVTSKGASESLFEEIVPEVSGIDFVNSYDHPQRWRGLWRQYFIGTIGSGISVADVNGDRLPDIYLVGKDDSNALYLNRGDFRFEDVTESVGVSGGDGFGAGAAMVDIDNDGDLDIYVCYVDGANELYVNDGEGRFEERAEEWGLALDVGSNAASFADYDRDGDLDLYLQRNYMEGVGKPEGLEDLLLENRGGVFVDVSEESGIAGIGQGHAAIWWDYDADGWVDIYVANDFAMGDKLYRNNGDGTFKDVLKEAFAFAPYSAMGADFGDLNNDGLIDFVVGEMAPRDRAYYMKSVGPLSGKLFSIDREGVGQFMQNAVSINQGQGRFFDAGFLTGMQATDWTWAPRLLDLDNDGRLDVFFTNGMARAFHDADLGLRVARAPNVNIQRALYQRSEPLRERNLAFRNEGGLRFSEVGEEWGLGKLGVSFAAASGDFDRDGDLDLVVGNWKEGVSLYRNNGDAGKRLLIELKGTTSNRMGVGSKVRVESAEGVQVRELTSTRGYLTTDEPVAQFSFREVERVDAVTVEWPNGIVQRIEGLETGYRYRIEESLEDEDGVMVVEAREERDAVLFEKWKGEIKGDRVSVELWERVDRDQALRPFYVGLKGPRIVVVDANEDGWNDVVLEGGTGKPPRVFRNEGGKRLVLGYEGAGGLGVVEESRLIWGLGAAVVLVEVGGECLVVAAGEGLRRRYPRVEANRVFRQRNEKLETVDGEFAETFGRMGAIGGMAVADVDGDGDGDLVVAEQWGGVELWRNDGRELRKDEESLGELAGIRGLWESVLVEDFDGDGRVDLLLGNLGLNTKYQVRGDREYTLYFSRDDEASPRLFFDALAEGGKAFPMETRTLHQMYLPEEMAKTGSYEAYGNMTMEEAFGEAVMAGLERVSINEAESLLLLQGVDGRFVRSALPYEAQLGRMVDAVALDVDGDGDRDVVAVMESLEPQPWVAVGPDGTLLLVLRNLGDGAFEAVLPGESGLMVEVGRAKRLAVGDLDGDGIEELVVGVSGGEMAVFEVRERGRLRQSEERQ